MIVAYHAKWHITINTQNEGDINEMIQMSALSKALYDQIADIGKKNAVPSIQSFEISPAANPDRRRNNFAYLRLSDGSIGLTYVALGQELDDLNIELPRLSLNGQSPIVLAERYKSTNGWERALGLAAINALGQHLLSRHAPLAEMPANIDQLASQPGERIGMVGYFGRVIEPLREMGVAVTVVELDESLLRNESGLEVTLDASRLQGCAQVIITGTTLLNNSLEQLLEHCSGAREIYLLGPSASCLPDVLFAAGITCIGGFRVTKPDLFAQRWLQGGRWRDAGQRYRLTRDSYAGLDHLLDIG